MDFDYDNDAAPTSLSLYIEQPYNNQARQEKGAVRSILGILFGILQHFVVIIHIFSTTCLPTGEISNMS